MDALRLTLSRGKFAQHFEKSYFCNNQDRANLFEQEYSKLRNEYSGLPFPDNVAFDTELVSIMISKLKPGKAAGIDGWLNT